MRLINAAGHDSRSSRRNDAPPRFDGTITRRALPRATMPARCSSPPAPRAKPKCCVLSNDYFLRIARLVRVAGRRTAMQERRRDRADAAADVPHECARLLDVRHDPASAARSCRSTASTRGAGGARLRDAGATIVHYLGVMPAILLQLDAKPAERTHRVRFGFGAGVDPRHQETFERRFGFPLVEAWAMTETGGRRRDLDRAGGPRHVGQRCIGRPRLEHGIRIVDDTGADVKRRASPANCWCARAAPIRAAASSPAISRMTPRPLTPGLAAGFTPATWYAGDGQFAVLRRPQEEHRPAQSGENIAVIEVEGVLDDARCGRERRRSHRCADEIRGEEVFALIVPREPPRRAARARLLKRSRAPAPSGSPTTRCPATSPSSTRSRSPRRRSCSAARSGAGRRSRRRSRHDRPAAHSRRGCASARRPPLTSARAYDGVVVAAPVTIPYVRYSTRGRALVSRPRARRAGRSAPALTKDDLDGLGVSSFTLFPDTAVGLTQHLGLSPRWLDHLPMGGASGVVALRRAARAVQAGDAEIVACVAGDTNHVDSFRAESRELQPLRARRGLSVRLRRAECELRAADLVLHARTTASSREDFGKLCVAQRDNALRFPYALFKKPLTLDEYLDARPIADPLRLFDCVMPCAGAEGFPGDARGPRASSSAFPSRASSAPSSATMRSPTTRSSFAAAGRSIVTIFMRRPAFGPEDIDLLETLRRLSGDQLSCSSRTSASAAKGEAPAFVRAATASRSMARFPLNTSGGQLVGRTGRRRRRLSRPRRGDPAGHRPGARRAGRECPASRSSAASA